MGIPVLSMKVDVVGRIRNIHVSVNNALNPVFEAVVNSIHSTEERFGNALQTAGKIDVRLFRTPQLELATAGQGRLPAGTVDKIVVIDNGRGFTDANLEAFATADTTTKLAQGGKGVGRLTWLVVFEQASISSVCQLESGTKVQRTFTFKPTEKGIERFEETAVNDDTELETRIELQGVRPGFVDALRKTSDHITDRLFEHCFNYFVIARVPTIRVIDEAPEGTTTSLVNAKYEEVKILDEAELKVGKHSLKALPVQHKHSAGRHHEAHLCAHNRVVTSMNLSTVSNIGADPIKAKDGELVVHHVFVSGKPLDDAVDASRTRLDLPDGEPLFEATGALDLKTLRSELGKHVDASLAETIYAAQQDNFAKIEKHVRTQLPEYRHLLSQAPELVRRVRFTDDYRQLDQALYGVKQQVDSDLRRKQTEVQEKFSADDADPHELAAAISELIEKLGETGKSELVRYVAKRKAVLELLRRLISRFYGQKVLEEHVHRIVYPLKKKGDEVAYEDHNLWLVDDSLSFYEYLSSDVSLRASGLSSSKGRPDIFAVKEGDPYQHIALVEFKKPDRDDEDPVAQLIDYATKLREGDTLSIQGVTIPPVDIGVRIDAFAIVTMTNKMGSIIKKAAGNLRRAEDWRWTGRQDSVNMNIEVLDFNTFIRRAEQRNRAFFNKLGLP